MQKLKLFGLFAALAVVLVACPPTPPVTPPPPPPPTTPPAPPPSTATTIQGTLEGYTRGAHKLKFQVSSPTYTQTVITEGQLAADGNFQITLPDESKLTGLLKLVDIGNCTGSSVTKDLQTTSGGSLIAYSSGPNPTGFLIQGSQPQTFVGNPPPGTIYTYYLYADRDGSVVGTCNTLTYDITLKKGWNLVAGIYGQNGTHATSSVPTGLKWYYLPTGATVNVTAPTTKLEIGKSYTFTATAQDSDGQPISGTPTWASTDPTNMPVSADGVVTPKGFTSNVTISANLNGASGAIQNIQSYGLQIAGGTYNTGIASLGTAFLMRYVDDTGLAPTTDRSFNVTGPGGWNGGAGLSVTYPANATSAWVARGDILPVTGNYAFTTTAAPTISSLRAQSLSTKIQSVLPSRSSIMPLGPIPFTPGKVVTSSNAISVVGTGTGFAIDATQSLGQAANITIGDGDGNYTTSSVMGRWTSPNATTIFGSPTFEARVLNINGQVLGRQTGSYYSNGATSTVIDSLSLDTASSYEWRVISFNTDAVNVQNYNFPVQFNASRAAKTFDFKPAITGLSFGGATTDGGMELVINGRQFQNNSTIKFGSIEATSITATQPNKINLIVPKSTATGIVDLTVTTPAGTSATSAATKFEYLKVTEYALNTAPILAAGPDGNLWYAETGGPNSSSGVTQIRRITSDGTKDSYDIITPSNSIAYLTDLSAGPNNTVWFSEGNYNAKRIGKVNAVDGKGLTWYTLDDSANGAAALTTGADGKIWFLEFGGTRIGRMNADGTQRVWFPVALGGAGTFSSIYDIKLGPDGNVWFSAPGGRIGKVTPSGTINAYTVSGGGSPTGLTSGPNNLMWFTNGSGYGSGNGLGNADTNGTVNLVNPLGDPSKNLPVTQRLATDATGNLWFGIANSGFGGNNPYLIGRFKPGGVYTPITVTSANNTGCCSIGVDSVVFVGGHIWYARPGGIGVLTP